MKKTKKLSDYNRTVGQTDGQLIQDGVSIMSINGQFNEQYDGYIIHHDGLHEKLFGFDGLPATDSPVYLVATSGPQGNVLLDY